MTWQDIDLQKKNMKNRQTENQALKNVPSCRTKNEEEVEEETP